MVREVHDEDRQELRLAVVMTGGVSLAVWMGGVALELDRLRSGPPGTAYAGLLDLIQADVQIDVISGTSAGGLNGALLSASIAYDTRLDLLRRTWIADGDMLTLIRDPKGDPLSLMQGDEVFLPAVHRALEALRGGEAEPVVVPYPLELYMTASLLTAQPQDRTDRYGGVFPESTHLGLFHFDRDRFSPVDAVDCLALAARTSAAHPGGFEASYVPMSVEDESRPLHPSMAGIADWSGSRYCVDGGVLLNRPLRPAIDAIFRQPAEREVRRAVLFVSPDPGESAKDVSQKQDERPTLLKTVASVVSLPRVQSISEELEMVETQNEETRRRRRVSRALRRSPRLSSEAWSLFQAYQVVKAQRDARRVADLLGVGISGPHERAHPAAARAFREMLEAELETRIGSAPRQPADVLVPWRWGTGSIRRMAISELDILTRAIALTPSPLIGQSPSLVRTELRTLRGYVHAVLGEVRVAEAREEAFWRARRPAVSDLLSRPSSPGEYAAWLDEALTDLPSSFELRRTDDAPAVVTDGRERLAATVGALMFAVALVVLKAEATIISPEGGAGRESTLMPPGYIVTPEDEARIHTLAEEVRGMLPSQPSSTMPAMAAEILALFEAIIGIGTGPLPERGCSPSLAADVAEVLAQSEGISSLFREAGREGLASQVDAWLFELLAVEVAQAPLLASELMVEQEIELAQVSAATQNALSDPRILPQSKLTGIQLAHFGAFYKRSWRANDWMWGRLDGAFQLALVLIDPARLRRLGYGVEEAVETFATLATQDPDPAVASWLATDIDERKAELREELGYLDQPDPEVPTSLPRCAWWVARRLQLNILLEELPWVAGTVALDMSSGGAETKEGLEFLSAYLGFPVPAANLAALADGVQADIEAGVRPLERELRPEEAVNLLHRCFIGQERIRAEYGSDRFVETATKAAATAVGALRSPNSGLGLIAGLVGSLRGSTLATYYLAKAAVQKSRASLVAYSVGAALAAALLALVLVDGVRAPNLSIGIAAAMLVAVGILITLRGHDAWTLLAFVVAVIFTLLTLGLTGGWFRFLAIFVALSAIAALIPLVLRRASMTKKPVLARITFWAGITLAVGAAWFAFAAAAQPANIGLKDNCGAPIVHVQRQVDEPQATNFATPAIDHEKACAGINADLTRRFAAFAAILAGLGLAAVVTRRSPPEEAQGDDAGTDGPTDQTQGGSLES